jgi:hypothetical protein
MTYTATNSCRGSLAVTEPVMVLPNFPLIQLKWTFDMRLPVFRLVKTKKQTAQSRNRIMALILT